MNNIEQTEEFGDGYHNEFQRCLAQSQMQSPCKNELATAVALSKEGKTVVEHHPVYCKVTDALVGTESRIVSIGRDYESAIGPVLNAMGINQEFGDSTYEIFPKSVTAPSPIVFGDNEIPF